MKTILEVLRLLLTRSASITRTDTQASPTVNWDAITEGERWLDEKYFELENARLEACTARNGSFLVISSGLSTVFLAAGVNQIKASGLTPLSLEWCLLAGGSGLATVLLIGAVWIGLGMLLGIDVYDPPSGDQFYAELEAKAGQGQSVFQADVNRYLALHLRKAAKSHAESVGKRHKLLLRGVWMVRLAFAILACVFLGAWALGSIGQMAKDTKPASTNSGGGTSPKPAAPQTNLTGRPTQKDAGGSGKGPKVNKK